MTPSTPRGPSDTQLATRLALLFRIGSVLAALLLILGTAFAYVLSDSTISTVLLTGGCALIVLLPVVRLAMMTGHFARAADRPFAVISALVILLVITTAAVSIWW